MKEDQITGSGALLSFIVGSVLGIVFTLIFMAYAINGPFQPQRELASYRQGVEDGMKGKFKVEIESTYKIISTENENKE